jgi:Poly (ADP-ribose) glycohydrolase (PARG)
MKNVVFPGIENLARELQPEDCRILMAGQEGKLEVSKRRIAQILANSFFCNFSQNTLIPHFNFDLYNEELLF